MDAEPLAKRICDEHLSRFPAADRGAVHVVMSDYNLEDEFITGAFRQLHESFDTTPRDEWHATAAALEALSAMSEAERTGWYADLCQWCEVMPAKAGDGLCDQCRQLTDAR